MRKLAIAMALASTALATPAVARDNSWYAGIEGGLMGVEDGELDAAYTFNGVTVDDEFAVDFKTGVDLDIIGGYDFGMFRVEVEAGYKNASISEVFEVPQRCRRFRRQRPHLFGDGQRPARFRR